MRLKLLQAGEPVLRQAAKALTVEEIRSEYVQQLIGHIRDTMLDAPGVGLAAPQIGVGIQLAVVEDTAENLQGLTPETLQERERRPVPFQVLVNPRILRASNPDVRFFEGCLSLNGFMAVVPRSREILVECLDENGVRKVIEASGWHARILQHEIDHLHATLYIDRMQSRTFMSVENYNRHWKHTTVHYAIEQLCGNAAG